MKLVGIVRPTATLTVEGVGIDVDVLRAAVLDQQSTDHKLAQLLVGSGRVDGNLTGTGVFPRNVGSRGRRVSADTLKGRRRSR